MYSLWLYQYSSTMLMGRVTCPPHHPLKDAPNIHKNNQGRECTFSTGGRGGSDIYWTLIWFHSQFILLRIRRLWGILNSGHLQHREIYPFPLSIIQLMGIYLSPSKVQSGWVSGDRKPEKAVGAAGEDPNSKLQNLQILRVPQTVLKGKPYFWDWSIAKDKSYFWHWYYRKRSIVFL